MHRTTYQELGWALVLCALLAAFVSGCGSSSRRSVSVSGSIHGGSGGWGHSISIGVHRHSRR